jgi:hypothetical protein
VAHQDVPQEAPLLALLERRPVAVEGVWQEQRPLRAQQRQPPRDAPQAASREAPQERPQRRPRGAPQRRDVSQPTPQKPPRATPQSSPQVLGTYDPHAAAARIQELRRQGLSFTVIADQLTVAGIPTRYGLPWQHSRVRHVLNTYGRETEPSQDDQP